MGQWQRSAPHFRDAVDFVRSGKLGRIRMVRHSSWMRRSAQRAHTLAADSRGHFFMDGAVNGSPVRGGLVYAGVDGAPTQQGDQPAAKFSPRVGLVYSVNPRTVIRGGSVFDGTVKLDERRNAVADIFLTEVIEGPEGNLVNKTIKVIPQVDQTLGVSYDEFLKYGAVSRENPKCE